MVFSSTTGYDTQVDDEKAFANDARNTATVQLPVGISVRSEFRNQQGWTIRPVGDLTLTAITGDTKQKTDVSGNRGVVDTVTGEFTGKFVTSLNLGLQADKGNTTFGVNFCLDKGDSGRQDANVKLQLRHAF